MWLDTHIELTDMADGSARDGIVWQKSAVVGENVYLKFSAADSN